MDFLFKIKDILRLDFPRSFDGFHHFHLRKRTIKNFEEKAKVFVDKSIYVVSVLFPLMTVPQIYQIFSSQDAGGLSLFTWSGYLFGTFFWFAYGYLHKDRPIMLAQLLWFFIYVLIIFGIILYSK